jgi:N,N-dimethylformamidase
MLPLAAYADRLSVRAGETISFHVASASGRPVTAKMVRVVSSDANPAGPGIQIEEIDARTSVLSEPGAFSVPRGSYAIVDGLDEWLSGASFTLACRVYPTHFGGRRQSLLARIDEAQRRGFALMIGADGRLQGSTGNGDGFDEVRTEEMLTERRWYSAWLRFDADARELQIGYSPVGSTAMVTAGTAVSAGASPAVDRRLLMAAANDGAANAHLNGKLERPVLYDHALSDEELRSLAEGTEPGGAVACWDFVREVSSSRIVDVGPNGLHGRLVNTPARGMTGASWSAREMCFRHAPHEYGAIHFHEDDTKPRKMCPSTWCLPGAGRLPTSPCSHRRSPIRSMPTTRARNGIWIRSGRRPGVDRRRIGVVIRTTRGTIASTGCRPTTTTRTAAASRSPRGDARC